jgi:ATP dependent DNA ligase domain
MFVVFDLLHRDGRDLIGHPLRERRARLEDIVTGSEFVLPVRRLARNGFESWSEVIARDYEGVVAKDETSLYEAGPTRRWLKVKQKCWTVAEDRWQRRISTRVSSTSAWSTFVRAPCWCASCRSAKLPPSISTEILCG